MYNYRGKKHKFAETVLKYDIRMRDFRDTRNLVWFWVLGNVIRSIVAVICLDLI